MATIKKLLKIYFLFFIILSITTLIYTLLIYNELIRTDEEFIRTCSFIIGNILFLILGVTTTIYFDNKGWLRAGISSIILIILMIMIKLISCDNIDILYIVKICSYLLVSMLGGIFGINLFHRKKKE